MTNVFARARQKTAALPRFVIEDHPKFVSFIQHYYEWMATEGADLGLEALKLSNDIDLVPESLINGYQQSFSPNIPSVKGDYRHFAKFLKEFYQLRGTPESFKIFYKTLFGTDVSILFPREQLFKPSSGSHTRQQIILAESDEDLFLMEGKDVGPFTIDRVYKIGSPWMLLVEDITEVPKHDQMITDGTTSFTIKSQWKVDSVTQSGEYHEGDMIEKDDMIFRVDAVHQSGIIGLDIESPGTGYHQGDSVEAKSAGLGSGFSATVDRVGNNGEIQTVKITRTGFGFDTKQVELTITSTGKGAIIKPQFKENHLQIKYLTIIENSLANEETKTLTLANGTKIIMSRSVLHVKQNTFSGSKPSTSAMMIHDSDFYQEFSYVIQSSADTKMQERSLRSLLHIAGLKMFTTTIIS